MRAVAEFCVRQLAAWLLRRLVHRHRRRLGPVLSQLALVCAALL